MAAVAYAPQPASAQPAPYPVPATKSSACWRSRSGARLAAAAHASGMLWDASLIRTDKPDYWLEALDDLDVLYLLQHMLASRS